MNDRNLGEKLNFHLRRVYSYLLRMGATHQDAEDIIQETAYKFLIYIESMEIKKIESWLFRVAINLYYDFYRKQTNRQTILMTFEIQELFDDFSPEKAVIQKDHSNEIHKILNELKPVHKQLLILKYSTGLKIDEIAALLEMKQGTIKTTLHRARRAFIEIYRRKKDDNE
ncbi:RNA polymerase sigma factor [Metabacillus fastidiosus]|uniref:RNA polymerase sigma factor n=1 Tax=Metabacillus fastidiosus TaxID=1458 RepID=UPI003D282F40